MTLKEKLEEILEKQSVGRGEYLLSTLPPPSLIPGMTEASKLIINWLKEGKRGLIVGDYDCDGIMATTIMQDFFITLGFGNQVEYIVPDRFIDGYGVSRNMVNFAIENMFDFIITVDNGIGAGDAVKYAKDNNINVIITDHHTPGNAVPVDADIIIDLKYNQGEYPFMEISGATISWYLCAQIRKNLDAQIDMRKWLDLVGITVISDVMPLQSVNLPFVYFALDAIKNANRYVYKLAFNHAKRKNLTETDVAFGFVPMINAIGRIDHAKNAVNLMLSKNKTEIQKGFKYMQDINNKRKFLNEELLARVMPEAEIQASEGSNAIIVCQEDLHEGIVGILAGKLAEKFMRPAFVFGWNEGKNCWKGSGRTSGIVQLYNLTNNAADHALGFGGHAGAVGVAIEKDNFNNWKKEIVSSAEKIDKKEFIPVGEKPIEVNLSEINMDILDTLDKYRPFGEGFPEPTFKSTVFLNIVDSYKEGLHWKCLLVDQEGNSINSWFFHDKGIINFNQQEVEIIFTPVKIEGSNGTTIELHSTINYLGV